MRQSIGTKRVSLDSASAFANAVQLMLDEIAIKPDRFPFIDGDVREGPVPGFPYCIYYRVRTQRVVIVAVYHQSRDPLAWRERE